VNFIKIKIYYYNGYLYVVKFEGGKAILEQISLDGNERKELGDLCVAFQNDSMDLVFCDNNVYFTYSNSKMEEAEQTSDLYCFSLKTNTCQIVYQYTGTNAKIITPKGYGKNVYFLVKSVSYENNTVRLTSHGIYQLNTETSVTENIISEDVCDYCIDIQNGYIYYKLILKLNLDIKYHCWQFNLDGTLYQEVNIGKPRFCKMIGGDSKVLFAELLVDNKTSY
jgi:hypothetical protein